MEEVVVLGYDPAAVEPKLTDAVAARIETIEGVRECTTPGRLMARMQAVGVSEAEARKRVTGLLLGEKGDLAGIVIGLNQYGAKHRGETVAEIRQVLDYCLLDRPDIALTGSPVLVSELDRLGRPEATTMFFGLSLLICLGLLKYSIGDWTLSLSLLGVTVWTICFTKALVLICGGEMNFIMGALSIMVMIFTLTIAIHYLDYYTEARDRGVADPIVSALKECWRPSFLSTVTTLLGLLALNVSHILPVRQFGSRAQERWWRWSSACLLRRSSPSGRIGRSAPNGWFDFAKWGLGVSAPCRSSRQP